MKTLKTFRIHLTTKSGIGFITKKAKSIEECFAKLYKFDRTHCTSIEDIDTDDVRFVEDGILLEDGVISTKY